LKVVSVTAVTVTISWAAPASNDQCPTYRDARHRSGREDFVGSCVKLVGCGVFTLGADAKYAISSAVNFRAFASEVIFKNRT